MHEASLYDSNQFVTLTYADSPESLRPDDFVLFMKRLRKARYSGLRFFQCGEYGEKLLRPHHHALLFNCDFPDKRKMLSMSGRFGLYISDELDSLWGHGHCFIGNVTFESAGYVARYAMKKVTGPAAADYYMGRIPEYLTMSRRPGIGAGWVAKFRSDVYPADEVVVNGHRSRPPRYYDNILATLDGRLAKRLKRRREAKAVASPDNTGPRLLVREAVKLGSLANLPRKDF